MGEIYSDIFLCVIRSKTSQIIKKNMPKGGTGDRSVSYPFFSGYGRDEAFPQDTDLSPVPRMEKRPLSRALEGGFIAIKNCVNTEKMCQKRKKTKIFPLLFVPDSSVL